MPPNESRLEMVENATSVPTMTVAGGVAHPPSAGRRILTDGALWSGLGGAIAGGFGVEAAKTLVTDESGGRWWFVLGLGTGVALALIGAWLRYRAEAKASIGVVVTAVEPGRGVAHAEQFDRTAVEHSRADRKMTVRTTLALPAAPPWPVTGVDALAEETVAATTMVEAMTGSVPRIDLFPTMPLAVGFRYGAKLGQSLPREVVLYSPHRTSASATHFPAVTLREERSSGTLLVAESIEVIESGDPSRTALAVDVQAQGGDFVEPVRAACREYGMGNLLLLRRSAPGQLTEDSATFTAIVEQACRAWRDAPLSATARTGRRAVFLNGPVVIAVALGARLANVQPDRWTAYTFNRETSGYDPFPA
ncbi:hypothetical protein BJY14_007856 [Actinomadura luteofluorescens]|uniref:SAVED domain-containing protein n=2 Tax=Actinomadura luteofluorescens TaxID=46163 RepID=A0A7Y9EQ30_9ACTN|nr:SAVED domain-containing protein [Actinomadura luteofluorescens]NYD51873.1 hypothetical protein [Actinomadura luteofluorescens]